MRLSSLMGQVSALEPIRCRRLRVVPLRSEVASDVDYLLFDDVMSEALVEVEEVSPGGSVPQLRVRNRADRPVLAPDGSTLVGAKQNRVLNVSVLLPAKSDTIVPVSCVERGRWSIAGSPMLCSEHSDHGLRRLMAAETTCSLSMDKTVQVDQGAVWGHVDNMLTQTGSSSTTSAYHAAFAKWEESIADYAERLVLPKEATGAAVFLDDVLLSVDLFDKPGTLATLWPRMSRAFAMAAVPLDAQGSSESSDAFEDSASRTESFLEQALADETKEFPAVGLGSMVRIANNAHCAGGALVHNGSALHTSLFPASDLGAKKAAAVAPVAVAEQAVTDEQPRPSFWKRLWRR